MTCCADLPCLQFSFLHNDVSSQVRTTLTLWLCFLCKVAAAVPLMVDYPMCSGSHPTCAGWTRMWMEAMWAQHCVAACLCVNVSWKGWTGCWYFLLAQTLHVARGKGRDTFWGQQSRGENILFGSSYLRPGRWRRHSSELCALINEWMSAQCHGLLEQYSCHHCSYFCKRSGDNSLVS